MEIDEETIDTFTNGDCWALAIEIARQDPSWKVATTECEDHCFVIRDNKAMDVHGCTSIPKLLLRWDKILNFDPNSLSADPNSLSRVGKVYDSVDEASVALLGWN